MATEDIIRMAPVELSVRIGEHVTRFTCQFPPFRVLGRLQTEDGDLYAIQWESHVEEEKDDDTRKP